MTQLNVKFEYRNYGDNLGGAWTPEQDAWCVELWEDHKQGYVRPIKAGETAISFNVSECDIELYSSIADVRKDLEGQGLMVKPTNQTDHYYVDYGNTN